MIINTERDVRMGCGLIHAKLAEGYNPILRNEMRVLQAGILNLKKDGVYFLETGEREYGILLIEGHLSVSGETERWQLGKRENPFRDPPCALLLGKSERVEIRALEDSIAGICSAPAKEKKANSFVGAESTGAAERGKGNWSRLVRFVLWPDNSEGNQLMVGETVVSPGNWATFPPHRHQYNVPGKEAAYEEAYLFRFSNKQGYGFVRQYDDDKSMDQTFCVGDNDLVYMDKGYHPVACSPAAWLYQATFMAGENRISQASVDPDYLFVLEQEELDNPYKKQVIF